MSKALIDKFLGRVGGPRRSGAEYSCFCPAHHDRQRSLSLGSDEDGNVLLYCHAGCPTKAVLASIGLCQRDMFVGGKGGKGR